MVQTILTYGIIALSVGVTLWKTLNLVGKKPVVCQPEDVEKNKCSACAGNCPFNDRKT
jgi:hypothetical protein